jgi:hypothetical protein
MYMRQAEAEAKKNRHAKLNDRAVKHGAIQNRRQYDSLVKELYAPEVDKNKQDELEVLKARAHTKPKLARDLRDYDDFLAHKPPNNLDQRP